MFRFVHVTDAHLSDRPVGNRIPTYPEDVKAKLSEVIDICIREQAHLINTGDLFDQKRPSLVSHKLIRWLIEEFGRLQAAGLKCYSIAGNHDLSEEGMASIDRQPLGVLAAAGAIELLLEPQLIDFDGTKVQLTPFNYDERGEWDPTFFQSERMKKAQAEVWLTHGALVPDGMTYPFPTIAYSSVVLDDSPEIVFCGHMHHAYPFTVEGKSTFLQAGSLARRSRTQKRSVEVSFGYFDDPKFPEYYSVTIQCAKPWQEIFTEEMEMPEYLIDPDMADFARDARERMTFNNINFKAVLDEMAPGLNPAAVKRVRQYLEYAESEIAS